MSAHSAQHQSAGDRVTGDRADDGERELVDAERHRVDAGDHLALLRRPVGRHRLEVGAGREAPLASGEHERARRLAGDLRDCLDQLAQQVHVHRVRRRSIDGQHDDAVVVLAQAHMLHAGSVVDVGASRLGRGDGTAAREHRTLVR